MKIPKFVQELMSRATWEYDHPDGEPGYTVRIRKATPYTRAETLKAECERLVAWANRQPSGPETAYLLSCHTDTHYTSQSAIVTIFDPIMKYLEQYIKDD